MSNDKHEQAVDLTEEALGKLSEGDEMAAEHLVDKAKKLDPKAPVEVVRDLDEDAGRKA